MENTSSDRKAEALLLLYLKPEELQRRTPSERRLLAILQFADLPEPDESDDPAEQERRRALGAKVAQALTPPSITARRRTGAGPSRQPRGRRRGNDPPGSQGTSSVEPDPHVTE